MMKRIMTTIAILATLTLTGCSLNNELSPFIPVEAAGNESSITSNVSEVEEPTNSTSEVENETSINTSKPVESTSSKVEKPVESTSTTTEKPVSSSKVETPVSSSTSKVEKPASSSTTTSSKPVSSTSSTTTSKPVSSSTTSKPSTPVSSSSTTTSVSTSKPVEKVHDCSTDGHVWNVTTITSEPKWCREMHHVYDYGFDATLAERYLNAQESTYKIFKNTLKKMGIDGACGSGSVEVEVWGTETYETKICTICGHGEGGRYIATINPIGEWQFVDGVNRRLQISGINMNTLFYDPYNVPQVVIDNIILLNER